MTASYEFEIGKTYMVQWIDHWSYNGWHNAGDPGSVSDLACTTMGICTAVGDTFVHLSGTVAAEGTTREHIEEQQCTNTMGVIIDCIVQAWELDIK